MLKEILFISSLVLFIGIIEESVTQMDYTNTPATLLDNGKTTTHEHEYCVITFLTDVLGNEFDINPQVGKESHENSSSEEK